MSEQQPAVSPRSIGRSLPIGAMQVRPVNGHATVVVSDVTSMRWFLVAARAAEGPVLVVSLPNPELTGPNAVRVTDLDLRAAYFAHPTQVPSYRRVVEEAGRLTGELSLVQAAIAAVQATMTTRGRLKVIRVGELTPDDLARCRRWASLRFVPAPVSNGHDAEVYLRTAEDLVALLLELPVALDGVRTSGEARRAFPSLEETDISSSAASVSEAMARIDPSAAAAVIRALDTKLEGHVTYSPWGKAVTSLLARLDDDLRTAMILDVAYREACERMRSKQIEQLTIVMDAELIGGPETSRAVTDALRLGRKVGLSIILLGRNAEAVDQADEFAGFKIREHQNQPVMVIDEDHPTELSSFMQAAELNRGRYALMHGTLP